MQQRPLSLPVVEPLAVALCLVVLVVVLESVLELPPGVLLVAVGLVVPLLAAE